MSSFDWRRRTLRPFHPLRVRPGRRDARLGLEFFQQARPATCQAQANQAGPDGLVAIISRKSLAPPVTLAASFRPTFFEACVDGPGSRLHRADPARKPAARSCGRPNVIVCIGEAFSYRLAPKRSQPLELAFHPWPPMLVTLLFFIGRGLKSPCGTIHQEVHRIEEIRLRFTPVVQLRNGSSPAP